MIYAGYGERKIFSKARNFFRGAEAEQAKKLAAAKDAEIAKMQASLTPAQKEKADKIADAIKAHRIMKDMTIEQVKEAVPGDRNWNLANESNGVQTYVCSVAFFQNDDLRQTVITLATVRMENGRGFRL